MLEFYVESGFRLRQLRQCPIGTYLERFAEWLRQAGYKRRPGQLLLRGAVHFGCWALARGLQPGEVHEGVIATFARHVPRCACAGPFRGRSRYHQEGAQQLFAYLQRGGFMATSVASADTVPPVVEQFSAWWRQHRGIRESTLGVYVPLVREFLAAVGDDSGDVRRRPSSSLHPGAGRVVRS